MKFFIINGPNLNFLGIREPTHYGCMTYDDLLSMIHAHAKERNVEVECLQSNHEGQLVDWIQEAYWKGIDGIVLNPGAYTHTSIALLDALKAVSIPTVEVHISNVDQREPFRKISYVRAACVATISGHGTQGYIEALDLLIDRKEQEDKGCR